ncbi:MAG: hypothetical protein M1828_006796 [Chrysothrix sp. TS-e1954]|nr:MAG: hypothetical protein M1828_006796 [Chrysothrix sp. TS-e1954]
MSKTSDLLAFDIKGWVKRLDLLPPTAPRSKVTPTQADRTPDKTPIASPEQAKATLRTDTPTTSTTTTKPTLTAEQRSDTSVARPSQSAAPETLPPTSPSKLNPLAVSFKVEFPCKGLSSIESNDPPSDILNQSRRAFNSPTSVNISMDYDQGPKPRYQDCSPHVVQPQEASDPSMDTAHASDTKMKPTLLASSDGSPNTSTRLDPATAAPALADEPKSITGQAEEQVTGQVDGNGASSCHLQDNVEGSAAVLGLKMEDPTVGTVLTKRETVGSVANSTSLPTRLGHLRSFNPASTVQAAGWGKSYSNNTDPTRMRCVTLTQLAPTSTARTVASLVWGGPISTIDYPFGSNAATVHFVNAADCVRYYGEVANGIDFPGDNLRIVQVDISMTEKPVSDHVRWLIDCGCTRCVRAIGIDESWNMMDLSELARRNDRRLEHIAFKNVTSGIRALDVRFCDLTHAFEFKNMLSRDDKWQACNVVYAPDPCAIADGVHS